ncbi:MAG: SAM-dependent methyltransferase [Methanoregula sp.]|jgi:tRNA wybutosine-synthesizing protein 2|uniref:class I SAM-dependent methyltransferase n=1 Tax=Methanoregula sp. TaxID=2052170 RepID=UPI0025D22D3D|nr:SAM-dependent methyltransferase [Methanoregula sp.]MCK9630340.1 SAM-dependent methyltransferase [Methanoregula sp.]
MRARKIVREQLITVSSEDWVDHSRGVFVDGDVAWVPVKPHEPCDAEVRKRSPYTGKGYYMVGDVAVIHGNKPSGAALDAIIGFRHPRGIVWIESLHGVTRTPHTEILWGTAGEVRHKESGYTYHLDPQKVMFSMGNRNEKMRIADLIRTGTGNERVADMFAGIGYFTIPMAGAGAHVHAMEINPVAFGYLEQNIRENGFTDWVTATPGDCRVSLTDIYDRIVMGHFDAVTMVADALRHVRTGSILHVHSIGPAEDRIREQIESAGFSGTIQVHRVKKYRPHAWHVVQDVTIT